MTLLFSFLFPLQIPAPTFTSGSPCDRCLPAAVPHTCHQHSHGMCDRPKQSQTPHHLRVPVVLWSCFSALLGKQVFCVGWCSTQGSESANNVLGSCCVLQDSHYSNLEINCNYPLFEALLLRGKWSSSVQPNVFFHWRCWEIWAQVSSSCSCCCTELSGIKRLINTIHPHSHIPTQYNHKGNLNKDKYLKWSIMNSS